MLRDGNMNKLSPVMAQNEKAKQQLKGNRRSDEKVDRGYAISMVPEKGFP